MTFVTRTCAGCGKPGGTVAFRYQRTRNGKLSDQRDYFHPRCMRKKQLELDHAKEKAFK